MGTAGPCGVKEMGPRLCDFQLHSKNQIPPFGISLLSSARHEGRDLVSIIHPMEISHNKEDDKNNDDANVESEDHYEKPTMPRVGEARVIPATNATVLDKSARFFDTNSHLHAGLAPETAASGRVSDTASQQLYAELARGSILTEQISSLICEFRATLSKANDLFGLILGEDGAS